MSKQLFEFVKVAAGEPFPWPSGDYALKVENGQLTTNYTKFQQVFPVDAYYLRPAESPDAGREGFIEKVIEKVIEITGGVLYRRDAFSDFMRSNWPTPADPGSQVEAVDPVKLLEWLAMMNEPCHADNNFTHRIILSDGEFYWDQDVDGDQPIDPADLTALYQQSLKNKQHD